MMYAELYQYFILHKSLAVPGIGTFLLERKPAESDFVNRQIKPPIYTVTLNSASNTPAKNFFHWIGHTLCISDRDAVIRFNDFAFDIKKQINDGATIAWNGMGELAKSLTGEIRFTAATALTIEKPVAAEKVIREKAEHFVRVGEDEKTSVEMTAILNKPAVARSLWWVYALVLGALAIGFIGWHFYQAGFDESAFANNCKLSPMETPLP